MRQRMRPVDLARLLGRTPDWLRRLERQGRIPVAKRDFSGHRYYDVEDLARIRDILASRRSMQDTSSSLEQRFLPKSSSCVLKGNVRKGAKER